MRHKARGRPDALESAIETALDPGRFVSYKANFDFVRDLEQVEQQLRRLIPAEPGRAIALYETFLAGCHEKAEEIDDSSGSFGQFVDDLYRGWIAARQAAGADADQTVARLIEWMDDDPYGFASGLDKEVAKVLDRPGLAAFVRQARTHFDATATAKPAPGDSFRRNPDYQRRRWGAVLRTLHLARKDVEAYAGLAEETGLTAEDCHALATMLAARRKPREGLDWVERGIEIAKDARHGSVASHDLARLKRDLLTKLGRGDEALDAAWAEYCKHPSKYSYDDLMKYVAKADRAAWHDKAMEAAQGADLHSRMELLLETRETERLAELVRQTTDGALEQVSHYATEPAAKKLERAHPDVAARLWRAQGMRIVNAGKSKYYDAALSNFERAKRCYEKAGLAAEWEVTVSRVRAEHRRKTGFVAGFEDVVAGSGPSDKPSFLERAKTRWGGRQRGDSG